MKRRYGRGFGSAEKTELWDRWQGGESLKAIGRAFCKPSVVDIFPAGPVRRDPACVTAPIEAGVEPFGTRGDITRDRGPALDLIDGIVAGTVAVDGEPGSSPQWRL